MKIDETTVEIIRRLKDGRVPYKKIADDLSLAEGTVRTRVNKLKEEGILEITGLVDPEGIPGQGIVMIGVKLNTMDLVGKGEEISKLKGVVSVCVVTGRFDLMVTVAFKKGFGLVELYTQEMNKIDEIKSVETFVVYKSYNLKIPAEQCSL